MGHARSKNSDPWNVVAESQIKSHAAFQGDALKAPSNVLPGYLKPFELPFHPCQKDAGLKIGVLVKVEEVAAIPKNEIRNPGDQTSAIRTRYRQLGNFFHGLSLNLQLSRTSARQAILEGLHFDRYLKFWSLLRWAQVEVPLCPELSSWQSSFHAG